MPNPERPSAAALLGAGLSGALHGGSAVGVGEALVVLSSTRPGEYQALLYGAALYGVAGLVVGAVPALAIALGGRRLRLSPGAAWCLAFAATASAMGLFVAVPLADRLIYAERGVPDTAVATIVAGLAVASLLGVWLGGRLLTRTPLRVLPTAKGTAASWGSLALLAFLFSRAPAPGAGGTLAPRRPQPESFARKPDVVLIVVDGLRADALGVSGAGPDATPALDRLAEDAVLFEQHVAASSWTRPAFASLLGSLSPSAHGTQTRAAVLPDRVVTLAELLRENGYATGGLPASPDVSGARGFDQGFDWYPYDAVFALGARESAQGLLLHGWARDAWARRSADVDAAGDATAEALLARARAYVDANGDERFFLLVHLLEPIAPWTAHPEDAQAGASPSDGGPGSRGASKRRYADGVRHVDVEIGKFLEALRAEERYDDALIVVTGDHGVEFPPDGGATHGTSLHDEQLRAALIVKLPRNAYAGVRVPWQVRQIDVAPTVADLAGFPPDPSWEGASLFDDAFEDDLARMRPPEGHDADDPPFSPPTWADHPASREALSELDLGGYDLHGLRAEGRKVIQAVRTPPGNPRRVAPQACYDLVADPGEARDLVGSNDCEGALVARLQALVDAGAARRVAARPDEGAATAGAGLPGVAP